MKYNGFYFLCKRASKSIVRSWKMRMISEMMWRSLYHVKWYFAMTNLNTQKVKKANNHILMPVTTGLPAVPTN